jgi:isopenicillin N synthase-like dioxygenase
MLSVISGGRWPSSPHRVVLNRNERYSTAFFYDPNFSAMIEPQVPPTTPNGNDARILYGEYLMARFDKNYRYRSEME